MKINKRNIAHWLYLLLFGLNTLCAACLRVFRYRTNSPRQIVLYGHKLTGNLKALHQHINGAATPDMQATFLTLDPAYHRQLNEEGVVNVLATTPQCATLLSKADAVITDHGLHAMQPLLSLSNIKFFDVWHGIPFKGFDADDFRVQHRYTETWVSSPLLAKIYIERYGFPAHKVQVTGYARTDRLVRRDEDTRAIKRRLGLPDGKIVLVAPTWKQDAKNRSIFPFGTDEDEFYGALSEIGKRTGATMVMRTHLNSGITNQRGSEWENVVCMPHALYPDTEEMLLISDVLVCDWSSIAFDYLLLERPTVFLDVDPPFAKGFSLGAEYRFGQLVDSLDMLKTSIAKYLGDREIYEREHGHMAERVKVEVYGDYADGSSTRRCVQAFLSRLS